MTLKEKFQEWHDEPTNETVAENIFDLEKIANEFAVEFADWLNNSRFSQYGSSWINPYLPKNLKGDWIFFTSKELLEIYKKEKGL